MQVPAFALGRRLPESTVFRVRAQQDWADLALWERLLDDHPELKTVVEIGTFLGGLAGFLDDRREVYDEIAQVIVAAAVSANTDAVQDASEIENIYNSSESMIHDLKKKICTDILTDYLTNATNAFNVELSSNELAFERYVIYGLPQTVGVVTTEFRIRIRGLDSSFDD